MRWCRFQSDSYTGYGLIEGEAVVEVPGGPFESYTPAPRHWPLADLKLLVPCIPPTFYCAGLNYRRHIELGALRLGVHIPIPEKPDIGYRAVNALTAHEDPIVIPRDSSGDVHYEGELVAVIGRLARNVSRSEALDYVLGYTIGNDVSERTWQGQDRTLWRAKNADTFKPMGPWIATGLDPNDLDVAVKINGTLVSEFNTGAMLFDVAEYVSTISTYMTLHPGDILWTGTDNATGRIAPGDVVEIAIEGIGTLRNPVVAEGQ